MKKLKISSLIQLCIPLFLLIAFTLIIVFPQYVPFLQVHVRSYAGIGTESFAIPSPNRIGKAIKFNLKKVPAGVCPSGCVDIPDGTVVKEPFMIAETEVTVELWDRVVSAAGQKGYSFSRVKMPLENKLCPVEVVSWRDAIVWCNALSELLSLEPVYYSDEAMQTPIRSSADLVAIDDEVFVLPTSRGFRLPGSMEWEFAARYIDGATWTPGGHPSGSPYPYYYGSYATGYAVYMSDFSRRVKSKGSNMLGVYDMSGNVWEWCFDRFSDDKANPDAWTKRVTRGGGWSGNAYRLQIGGKFGTLPDAVERGQGFRIARSSW